VSEISQIISKTINSRSQLQTEVQINRFCLGGLLLVGGGREREKDMGRRIQYKYCVHTYVNGKMISVKTIPGRGERIIKENVVGGEFKYNISDIL
jgi:hypothetical protein